MPIWQLGAILFVYDLVGAKNEYPQLYQSIHALVKAAEEDEYYAAHESNWAKHLYHQLDECSALEFLLVASM